jgi:hypothetical protein
MRPPGASARSSVGGTSSADRGEEEKELKEELVEVVKVRRRKELRDGVTRADLSCWWDFKQHLKKK